MQSRLNLGVATVSPRLVRCGGDRGAPAARRRRAQALRRGLPGSSSEVAAEAASSPQTVARRGGEAREQCDGLPLACQYHYRRK